jgi:hypothetical protein
MYCPRCAAQNLDDAKFCRTCGINLETVALALSDQSHPARMSKDKAGELKAAKSWLEKRSEGVSSIVKGAGLLGASLLIGVALGLFSHAPDWIIIWVAMAGWMACWGVIALTTGIGTLLESKAMLRHMGQTAGEIAAPTTQPLPANDPAMLPETTAASRLPHSSSVTEHTTELLTKPHPTSRQPS